MLKENLGVVTLFNTCAMFPVNLLVNTLFALWLICCLSMGYLVSVFSSAGVSAAGSVATLVGASSAGLQGLFFLFCLYRTTARTTQQMRATMAIVFALSLNNFFILREF